MKMGKLIYNVISFVTVLSCHMCHFIVGNKKSDSFEDVLYHQNATLNNLDITVDVNSTNNIQTTRRNNSIINISNNSNSNGYNITGIEQTTKSELNYSDDTPLPKTILIASLAVAVGIFLFICLAYKWHTVQLDSQAKELAMVIGYGHCASACIPCSPCHNSHRLLPPRDSITTSSPSLSENDWNGARRKSLRTPSPILLSPPSLANQRGYSWNALSDQEVISHSPRRHSTFLL